jgi:hypothetical protein
VKAERQHNSEAEARSRIGRILKMASSLVKKIVSGKKKTREFRMDM